MCLPPKQRHTRPGSMVVAKRRRAPTVLEADVSPCLATTAGSNFMEHQTRPFLRSYHASDEEAGFFDGCCFLTQTNLNATFFAPTCISKITKHHGTIQSSEVGNQKRQLILKSEFACVSGSRPCFYVHRFPSQFG